MLIDDSRNLLSVQLKCVCCCQFVNAFSFNASLHWAFQVKKRENGEKNKFISGTKVIALCCLKVGMPCASEL